MPKVSQLPQDNAPVVADYLVGDQASGPTTQRFTLSALITLFWTLANIPAGGTSPITRDAESMANFVATGGIITGDSYGATLNASTTACTVYINGRRISMAAVAARSYTASKDTYVDILDNGDGTGTYVYTTVTNGATAPALAANSFRLGKVVTGASNIAAASSITQNPNSDGLGNSFRNIGPGTASKLNGPYKFSANGSTTTLTASTTAIANYATVAFDTGANFNKTTGLFTAPVAGFYFFIFEGTVGTSNGANNVGKFLAHKNAGDLRTIAGWTTGAISGEVGGSYPFFLQLAAGDTVGVNGLASVGGVGLNTTNFEGGLLFAT